jgi:membrane associated rhomboid family serine protease
MWFLWIFGDNVEDVMGSATFLLFYLAAGAVAVGFHAALMPGSAIPTVGASGAIAGVLGAYARAFPHARVLTLIPIFFFFQVVAIPAVILLGLWFLMQFISGTLSIGGASGGVAWWAHIAGFVVGFVTMSVFASRRRDRVVRAAD